MKRQFSILACLVLVVAMVFALASCDWFKPDDEHTHSFNEGKCECGEEDPNYVPPHTHNFVEGKCECGEEDPNYVAPECEHAYGTPEVTKEATCTEAGEQTLTCTLCGAVDVREIAPNGHTDEKVAGKAPTCTETGLTDGKKCTVCGVTTVEQEEINATGHKFVDGSCANGCGTADPNYNGPKTHEWNFGLVDGSAATDKTYIADGTTYDNGYFTTVGEVYYRYKDGAIYCVEVEKEGRGAIQFTVTGTATVEVMFSSTGGSNTSWVGIIDADGNLVANNEGMNTVTGANDGKTVFTYTLSAGTYRVVSPLIKEPVLDENGDPTYNEDGTPAEKNPYSRAARVYYVNVTETPAVVEPANKLNVTVTDTYVWDDVYTFTATEAGNYTFTVPAGLGFYRKNVHDVYGPAEADYYSNENGTTFTLALPAGYVLEFCVGSITRGEYAIEWTFEAAEVDPEACIHAYQKPWYHEENVAPTCTTAGKQVYECVLCNDIIFEDLAPDTVNGHDYSLVDGTYVGATCTTDGSGTYVCGYCEHVDERVLDKDVWGSHDYVTDDDTYVAPTCQENGYKKDVCNTCGDVLEETLYASGDYHVNDYIANGCISICSVCEHVGFDAYIDATETNYGINFSTNWMGEASFSIFSADYSVNSAYGFTYTVADGVYTLALVDLYENDTLGLVNASVILESDENGIYLTITLADGTVIEVTNVVEDTHVHSYFYPCDKVCQDCFELSNPDATHTVVHVEAKAATCTANGNVEYWYCSDCGYAWADEALTQVTNQKSVVIPAAHVYTYACDKICAVCFELTNEDAAHTVVHVDAKAATCTANGNVEYWYCSDCGYAWADEALTQVTNQMSVVIPAAHVYTYACDKICAVCFELTNEDAAHTVVHVDAKAATCTANGNVEYWYCSDCGYAWADEALTQVTNQMSVVVPSNGHADDNGDFKCDGCTTKMLPEDGTALTIPQAIAIAKLHGHNTYTTQKYYITGIVTNVYNTEYGNLYLKDAEGNQICIYGLYTWGNGSTNGTRYDKMDYKPVEGDELTVYTVLGMYNSDPQGKNAWVDEVVAHEHDYEAVVTAPTCTKGGYTTHTCTICQGYTVDSETEAFGHTTENGECERCGQTIGGEAPVIGELAKFDFGANGSAAHVDGNSLGTSKSYTVGNQTLTLNSMSSVYGPAYDLKGNSAIKLGTSSKTGSFTFTVGEDVTEVVIYVAQYKTNATKINVNGVAYTITTASNNGAYTAITIDTTTTKTVNFTTVSGGVRCMIDAIVFNGVVA